MFAKIINQETKEVQIVSGEKLIKLYGATEMEVEQAYNGSWYVKGFAPCKPQELVNDERVAELKKLLADSDYKAIKFAEGLLSVEEYAETKAQRQAWREEINQLQGEQYE